MTVVTSTGAIVNAFRNPDGSWGVSNNGTPEIATWGTATNATITTQPDGTTVMFAVAGD